MADIEVEIIDPGAVVGVEVVVGIPGARGADGTGGGGGASDAADVDFTPGGSLASTNVQDALEELDTEKAALASAVMDGDAAGGDLAGTYPNPSVQDDSHAHTTATLTGIAEFVRDTIGTALVAGSNVTITVDDAGDTITVASTGGGGGAANTDWLLAFQTTPFNLSDGNEVSVPFGADNDPSPRGTSISWSSGNATNVVIEEDGVYNISYNVGFRHGTSPTKVYVYPDFGSGPSAGGGPLYYFGANAMHDPVNYQLAVFLPGSVSGVACAAGDVIHLQVAQTGNASNDTECFGGALLVSRIA